MSSLVRPLSGKMIRSGLDSRTGRPAASIMISPFVISRCSGGEERFLDRVGGGVIEPMHVCEDTLPRDPVSEA